MQTREGLRGWKGGSVSKEEVMCVTARQEGGLEPRVESSVWTVPLKGRWGLSGGEKTGQQVQGGYPMGLSLRHVTKVSALISVLYLDLKSPGEARVSLNDIQRTGFLYVSLRMGLVKGFWDWSLWLLDSLLKKRWCFQRWGFTWRRRWTGGAGVHQVMATQDEAGAELHFMIQKWEYSVSWLGWGCKAALKPTPFKIQGLSFTGLLCKRHIIWSNFMCTESENIVCVPSLHLVLVQEYYDGCWHKLSSSLVLVQNPGQRFLNYATFIFKCDSIWIKGRIVSEILWFVLIAVKMMDLDRSWQAMNTYCVTNISVLLGLFKSGILMSPL